ncbi:response regulator transcription factor [Paeniglutamicibacter sp. MACA_103]|uniref:response regulator transcription factor n=1 Tax=Paeniglutamicibacter sp. MACA_103 TaxID=3377337 RepID=UPI003895BBC8
MDSTDRLRNRWLDTAAGILQEPDPGVARNQLNDALLESFRAFAAVRAPLAMTGGLGGISIFGQYASLDTPAWPLAVERAGTDHPVFAYHNATADPLPVTLVEVGERGWPVSEFAASMIERLGLSPHQLSLPLATAGAESATYGFVSDGAYLERDRETALCLQPIVRGLDAHIRMLESLSPAPAAAPERPLTPREKLVLALVARGCTAEGIAARLCVSPRTVHKHQENLYRKLGAVDRLSAVLRAQQCGLLPQQPARADDRPGFYAGNSHTPFDTASVSASASI